MSALEIDNQRSVYRQGDLLFMPIIKAEGLKMKQRQSDVVAHGESGNKHRMTGQTVIYDLTEPSQVGELEAPTTEIVSIPSGQVGELVHEEHGTQKLQSGEYAVLHEREYDSVMDNVNQIRD